MRSNYSESTYRVGESDTKILTKDHQSTMVSDRGRELYSFFDLRSSLQQHYFAGGAAAREPPAHRHVLAEAAVAA